MGEAELQLDSVARDATRRINLARARTRTVTQKEERMAQNASNDTSFILSDQDAPVITDHGVQQSKIALARATNIHENRIQTDAVNDRGVIENLTRVAETEHLTKSRERIQRMVGKENQENLRAIAIRQQQLENARELVVYNESIDDFIKEITQTITRLQNRGYTLLYFALFIAILADAIGGIATVTVIGYALQIGISACCTITIFMIILIDNSLGDTIDTSRLGAKIGIKAFRLFKSGLGRLGIVLFAGIAEITPAGILPLESLAMIIAIMLTKYEVRSAIQQLTRMRNEASQLYISVS